MNKILRLILIAVFLYFLILFQASLLPHFHIFGIAAVLIFAMTALANFFESPAKSSGIYLAFIGGFLLDVFSSDFIGRNSLILLGAAIFIKLFLRRYVRAPVWQF
jgi:rod shape-determining protein MreD